MRRLPTLDQRSQSQTLVRAMLGLNLVSILISYLSTRWDVAEHAKGAVDRFWYPPHYGIYFCLFMSALLSLAGLYLVLRGPGLPFEKLRRNPALTFVAVLNGVSFLGAPFDQWWHETYGLDLSTWSPPHIHLIVGVSMVILGCLVYFLDDGETNAPLQRFRLRGRQSTIYMFNLTVYMLTMIVLFLEYEMLGQKGGVPLFMELRPLWFFPLTWTTLVLFSLMLYVGMTRRVGLLSAGMAIYVVLRLLLLGVDRTLFDFEGAPFYPLLLPALAIDLTLLALMRGRTQRPSWQSVTLAALAGSAVLVLTSPLAWSFFTLASDYTVQPWLSYGPIMAVLGTASGLLGWACGSGLRRWRPSEQAEPSVQPQAALAS